MKLVLRFVALFAIASTGVFGFSQALTWPTSQYDSYTTDVGGQSSRPGVASAVFNNQVWVAYLKSNSCSGNLCQLVTKQNYGYGPSWSNEQNVQSLGVNITSNANPALAVLNGEMYLAYTDSANDTWIIATNNGVSWTAPYQISVPSGGGTYASWYSPVMAVDQYGSNNNLYLAFESGGPNHYPILCQVASNFSSQTCQLDSSATISLGYNPSIAVYNGIIYLGVVDGSGCLGFYQTSSLSLSGTAWYPIGCSTYKTNAAPSLAIYNGNLFTAFRVNGNANTMAVATQANFTSTFGNTAPSLQTLSFGIGTPQMLPITNTLTGFSNSVLNLFMYQNKLWYTDGY